MSLGLATTPLSLDELRSRLAPRRKDSLAFSEMESGIPRGAITELSGAHGCGKTDFVLRLIAENPKVHIAWVEDELSIYPCAFEQRGVQLGRVLFAEAQDQALWTALQMLRSGIFGIVVVSVSPQQQLEQLELRRLQLAAEQVNASVILLSEAPTMHGAWPISLQLEVRKRNLRRIK